MEIEFDREKGAPCQRACPAGIDVPRCHRLISLGKYDEALAVYLEKVPFPAVLGYVCPAPCESKCRMVEINEPVSIKALKRFAAEKATIIPQLTTAKPTNKRVAIVGSGPAGLTSAYYLATLGHSVTVFESLAKPGGMMRYGIPEYRLPRNVLNREIEAIDKAGVEIRLNSRVDSLESLFAAGYDAIFLALGAHKAISMGLNASGSIDCLAFLRDINSGKKVQVGERVGVIGGGNAAIDCARTALRLGARKATIVYRRTRDDMPASREEIEAALEEGVDIVFLAAPKKAVNQNGGVKLEFQRMKAGRVDASGRAKPEPIEGRDFEMEFDTLIAATGQQPDISANLGLNLSDANTIVIDNDMMTSRKGVFAGGDVVTGPAYVIDAIAAGRKAAVSIDKYLGGKGIIPESSVSTEVDIVPQIPLSLSNERVVPESLPVTERIHSFAAIESELGDKAAVEEAKRCLWCDLERVADARKCAQCRTCQLVCSLAYTRTFNLSRSRVLIGSGTGIEGEEPKFTDECINCNLCARYCSYDAISLKKAEGK